MACQDDLRLPEPVVVIQATYGVREVQLAELRAWRWDSSRGRLTEQTIMESGCGEEIAFPSDQTEHG